MNYQAQKGAVSYAFCWQVSESSLRKLGDIPRTKVPQDYLKYYDLCMLILRIGPSKDTYIKHPDWQTAVKFLGLKIEQPKGYVRPRNPHILPALPAPVPCGPKNNLTQDIYFSVLKRVR